MLYTRRDIGKIALATGFASGFGSELSGATKPNSTVKGVQIGVITYSYGSMPDQSAEATLQYVVDSGLAGCELMTGPVTDWARKKGKWDSSPAAAAAAAAAGSGGRGGFGRGGRGPAPSYAPVAGMKTGYGNDQPAGQWNGQTCPAGRGGAGAGEAARAHRADRVASAAASRRRSRRPRRRPSKSGAWRYRWTSSRICASCTTTPA